LQYAFTVSRAAAELRERFRFPLSIQVQEDGAIQDGLNLVNIHYERPAQPFTFE
jgi:hypothetical protein